MPKYPSGTILDRAFKNHVSEQYGAAFDDMAIENEGNFLDEIDAPFILFAVCSVIGFFGGFFWHRYKERRNRRRLAKPQPVNL